MMDILACSPQLVSNTFLLAFVIQAPSRSLVCISHNSIYFPIIYMVTVNIIDAIT